jgi:HSP20 family protein
VSSTGCPWRGSRLDRDHRGDEVLTVRAERTWTPEEGQQEVVVAERRQGTFSRQVFLGDNLDVDHVKATYDRGVLTLVIPVAQQYR